MQRAWHGAQPVHRAANGARAPLVLTRPPQVRAPQTLLLQARAAVAKPRAASARAWGGVPPLGRLVPAPDVSPAAEKAPLRASQGRGGVPGPRARQGAPMATALARTSGSSAGSLGRALRSTGKLRPGRPLPCWGGPRCRAESGFNPTGGRGGGVRRGAELAAAEGRGSEGAAPAAASPGQPDRFAGCLAVSHPHPGLSASGPRRICRALSARGPACLQAWVSRSRFPGLRNAPRASPDRPGVGQAGLSRLLDAQGVPAPAPPDSTRTALAPEPAPSGLRTPGRQTRGLSPPLSRTAPAGSRGRGAGARRSWLRAGCHPATGDGTRSRAQCTGPLSKDPARGHTLHPQPLHPVSRLPQHLLHR